MLLLREQRLDISQKSHLETNSFSGIKSVIRQDSEHSPVARIIPSNIS